MDIKSRLKDILSRPKEKMTRTVKWLFALPLAYITYLVVMLLVPQTKSFFFNGSVRYIILILSMAFICRIFLHFDFAKLISFSGKASFKTLFTALISMFITGCATTLLWKALKPESFEVVLKTQNLLSAWIPTAVYICLAAFFEELYFRAYILNFRDIESNPEFKAKDYIKFCTISGLVFTLAHFSNPEIRYDFIISSIFYFLMGFAFMFISIKTKGIEASLGMHIGNNLVSALICSYDNSVLSTATILVNRNAISPILIFQAIFCLGITIFILLKSTKKYSL